MTEISTEKNRILKVFARKLCGLSSPQECTKHPCSCGIAAEYKAMKNKIIPDKFRQFTIRDFHGKTGDNARLSKGVAARAKQQVFKYCWGNLSLLERLPLLSDEDLDKASVISDRIKYGQNVVIHGGPKRQLKRSLDQRTNAVTELPAGRTFIASIITNEAVKLRLDPDNRTLSYEWIEFAPFLQAIGKREGFDEEKLHYESCDWLVIDDITPLLFGAAAAHKAFAHHALDSFFARRIREKRPTVLVFKFDVEAHRVELEQTFGVAISKIINDEKTTVINLTDNDAKE